MIVNAEFKGGQCSYVKNVGLSVIYPYLWGGHCNLPNLKKVIGYDWSGP